MGTTEKKSWSDLSPTTQKVIVVAGVVEVVITAVALRDLRHRPKAGVRGPKLLWVVGFAVQPFGPLLYFWRGRRTANSPAVPGRWSNCSAPSPRTGPMAWRVEAQSVFGFL